MNVSVSTIPLVILVSAVRVAITAMHYRVQVMTVKNVHAQITDHVYYILMVMLYALIVQLDIVEDGM